MKFLYLGELNYNYVLAKPFAFGSESVGFSARSPRVLGHKGR